MLRKSVLMVLAARHSSIKWRITRTSGFSQCEKRCKANETLLCTTTRSSTIVAWQAIEGKQVNPKALTPQRKGLIFGQKSGILDSVSYKRTINWFSFFCPQRSPFQVPVQGVFFFSSSLLARSRSAVRGLSTGCPQSIHQRREFSTALSPFLARKWWIKGLPLHLFFRYTCSIK